MITSRGKKQYKNGVKIDPKTFYSMMESGKWRTVGPNCIEKWGSSTEK
jgi:hypothetical protein